MKIIESIEIVNYKSIISDTIELDDKTALVGANESGKSNILGALHHLEVNNQKKPFEQNEQNISVKHSSASSIKLIYKIRLTKSLIPNLVKLVPELEGKLICLSKIGEPNDSPVWTVEIDKLPKFGNLVIISPGEKTKVLYHLNKGGFKKEWTDENIGSNYFIGGGEIKLNANPFYKLIQSKQLTVIKDEVKKSKIESLIKDELLKNLRIYFWKYDPENYLKESISLEEFCKNVNKKKYASVTGILKIARDENAFVFELNTTSLRKNLIETDKTSRANLLEKKVAKQFNKIFNRFWRTFWGSRIKLKLNYEENDLTFRFDDGHDIPPEYRSDGFKWFLTFMINFQAKEKSLENYILLIDEPGGNLHPRGQKDALSFINKLNKKNQVIYSTNQTFLIDKNHPESIRILDRSHKFRGHDFYSTKVHNIRNEKNHILRDQLLRNSLGFTLSDISPINEINILVEGTFDRNVLYICNKRFKILDLNLVSVIDCGKATNIKFSAQQYLNSGLKVICLYDSDSDGKRAMSENKYVKDKFKLLVSNKSNQTIEDLLPSEVFENAFQFIYKKHKENLKTVKAIKNPYMNVLHTSYKAGLTKEVKNTIKHDLEDKMLEILEKNITNYTLEFIEHKLLEIKELIQ